MTVIWTDEALEILCVEGNHIPQQGNLKSHPPCVGETRNQF